jgi:hypothetical protein
MYDVFTPQNGVCFTIMLGFALATFYAHITTQLEDTYVCILENLGNLIGLAFSTLKTTYNRDRLMIPVSPLLL